MFNFTVLKVISDPQWDEGAAYQIKCKVWSFIIITFQSIHQSDSQVENHRIGSMRDTEGRKKCKQNFGKLT